MTIVKKNNLYLEKHCITLVAIRSWSTHTYTHTQRGLNNLEDLKKVVRSFCILSFVLLLFLMYTNWTQKHVSTFDQMASMFEKLWEQTMVNSKVTHMSVIFSRISAEAADHSHMVFLSSGELPRYSSQVLELLLIFVLATLQLQLLIKTNWEQSKKSATCRGEVLF